MRIEPDPGGLRDCVARDDRRRLDQHETGREYCEVLR